MGAVVKTQHQLVAALVVRSSKRLQNMLGLLLAPVTIYHCRLRTTTSIRPPTLTTDLCCRLVMVVWSARRSSSSCGILLL